MQISHVQNIPIFCSSVSENTVCKICQDCADKNRLGKAMCESGEKMKSMSKTYLIP